MKYFLLKINNKKKVIKSELFLQEIFSILMLYIFIPKISIN